MASRERPGIVLPAALICVVLIGALVAGAFIATTEETRMSANAISEEGALEAAETSVENRIAQWDAALADSMALGAKRMAGTTAGQFPSTTWLIRLDSTLFWVVAEGRGESQMAGHAAVVRQRVGVLVRTAMDSTGVSSVFPLDQRAWAALY
jgi:Tfp pilus assembly protein PilX